MDKNFPKLIYSEILQNKKKFEALTKLIAQENDIGQKIILTKYAAQFAIKKDTGYFSNSLMENTLLKIAQKYSIISQERFKKNSFLHVMTTCYLTGGHTRVVERWINNSDDTEKHSVILINQGERVIPDLLKEVITKKMVI